MATLKELREENARLKNESAARQDMKDIGDERAKLIKENKMLANPTKYALYRKVKKGTVTGVTRLGRGFAVMAKGGASINAKRKKDGKKHFGLNPDFFG